MMKNMSTIDRVIRILIAVILAVLYFTGVISGTLGIVLLVMAAAFVLTSFVSFCPMYTLLGIRTNRKVEGSN